MSNTTVQARISTELKQDAEAIYLFLQQSVNSGGLPFQPTAKMPSLQTAAALNELEDAGGQLFTTTEELFTDWKR